MALHVVIFATFVVLSSFQLGLIGAEEIAGDCIPMGSFERSNAAGTPRRVQYCLTGLQGPWDNAQTACKRYLPPDGHLIKIEDEEELSYVTRLLRTSTNGDLFFTGGKYDAPSHRWTWGANYNNGVAGIGYPIPWDNGQPNGANQNSDGRLGIILRNNIRFHALSKYESHSFICESYCGEDC